MDQRTGAGPSPALAGITVLELTTEVAGGYCGRLLAMLGADVIKVESLTRPDHARRSGPFPGGEAHLDRSGLHRFLNAQKRSLSLDVASASGFEILRRLAGSADVVLDDGALGAPPGVAERYAELLAANDQLVINAFSPYGLEGPRAAWCSSELTELAAAGWLQAAPPAGEPLMPGTPCGHYGAGTFGALGVLLALLARRRFGYGQLVETPLNEALLSILTAPTSTFVMDGRDGYRLGDGFPYGIYPCADGHLGVSILTQGHWIGLCRLMDRLDLLDDDRFRTGAERADPAVAAEIDVIISDWVAGQPAQETFQRGQALGAPIAIVPSPSQVLTSPQYDARAYWVDDDDPELGRIRLPGNPFRFASDGFAPFTRARRMGADTECVLEAAGVAAPARAELLHAGVLW